MGRFSIIGDERRDEPGVAVGQALRRPRFTIRAMMLAVAVVAVAVAVIKSLRWEGILALLALVVTISTPILGVILVVMIGRGLRRVRFTNLRRVRFTVRRLMVVIGFAGITFAGFRHHPSLGSFLAGASCLTLIRTCGAIDRARDLGSPMPPVEIVRVFLGSLAVASTMILMACLPALLLYPLYEPRSGCVPSFFSTEYGVLISVLWGAAIAGMLRRLLW